MNKKLIFFDIDGTLRTRDDYTIPESSLKAIQALKTLGHSLYLATGRGLYSARNMGRYLGIENVISDGGRIVYKNGQIVYSHPIPTDEVVACKQFAISHDIKIGYSNEYAIHSTSDIFSKAFSLDETIICSVKDSIDEMLLGPIYKIYIWADKRLIEGSAPFHNLEHHWVRENLCIIEHRHKDEGIRYLLTKYKKSKEECICFGDDINDIGMFDYCGLSICMGNGSMIAKQHADYIAKDIHQDGLYQACISLGLIKA